MCTTSMKIKVKNGYLNLTKLRKSYLFTIYLFMTFLLIFVKVYKTFQSRNNLIKINEHILCKFSCINLITILVLIFFSISMS